jgi:hypothetical protein
MDEEQNSEYSAAHLERCAKAGQAWGSGGGPAKTVTNWWSQKPYRLGAVDAAQARIDSDERRLLCDAGKDKGIWEPRHGAFVALVNFIPDSEKRSIALPKFYYAISRILLVRAGRWTEAYLLAHSAFIGCKVALAQTDHTHHRYNPAVGPDKQPIPGSAVFNPIPKTTLDLVITWNDYWGFSVPEPYWEPKHDLVAMVG